MAVAREVVAKATAVVERVMAAAATAAAKVVAAAARAAAVEGRGGEFGGSWPVRWRVAWLPLEDGYPWRGCTFNKTPPPPKKGVREGGGQRPAPRLRTHLEVVDSS